MKPEEISYVQFRVEQARETFNDAKSLLACGTLYATVNRPYYACFYGVLALLFTEGLESRKHKGILSAFDRQWIKTGRLPVAQGRFLRQLFDLRLQADYGYPLTLERADVDKWVHDSATFLADVLGLVEQALRESPLEGASE